MSGSYRYTAYTSGCDKVDVRFTTTYDVSNVSHVVGVTGSNRYLGTWDPKHAFILERRGTKGCWSSVVKLPLSKYFEWKLVVIDKFTRRVQSWEEYPNRWNWIDRGPLEIIVGWNSKELVRCSSCRCLVGICCCTTIYTNLAPFESLVDVTFRLIYSIDTDETIALIGSSKFLGDWDPTISRLFPGHHNPVLTIQLPMNTCFEWKLAVLNKRYRKVLRWEECGNRTLRVQTCPLEVGVVWSQVAEIGYKCYRLDPNWVISPCPCGTRYCYNTGLYTGDNVQTPSKALRRRSSTPYEDEQRELYKKHVKSVHFPDNPVTEVFGKEINSEMSKNDKELKIEMDSLGLAEMSYNNCSALRRKYQDQMIQTNEGKSFLTDNLDQKNVHINNRSLNTSSFNLQQRKTNAFNSLESKTLMQNKHNLTVDLVKKSQLKLNNESGLSLSGKMQALKLVNENKDNDLSQTEKYDSEKQTEEPGFPIDTKKQANDNSLPQVDKSQSQACDLQQEKLRPEKKTNESTLKTPGKLSLKTQPSESATLLPGSLSAKRQVRNNAISMGVKCQLEQKTKSSGFSQQAILPRKFVKRDDLTQQKHYQRKVAKTEEFLEQKTISKKLGKMDDLSYQSKQPQQVGCGDLSATTRRTDNLSKSSNLSLQAKQPEKLVSCIDVSLSSKPPQKRLRSGQVPLVAKKPEKLVSCSNLSLPRKQHHIISKGGDLSLPNKLDKHPENGNVPISKQPRNLFKGEDISLSTNEPLKISKSCDSPLTIKETEDRPESGDLSPPPEQPEDIPESADLSSKVKQAADMPRSTDLSSPENQTENMSENVDLSLSAKPTKNMRENVDSTPPTKQTDNMPQTAILSEPAKQQVSMSENVGLSPLAKQTGKISGTVDLPSQAKQTENMVGSVDLTSLAKETENMAGSVYLPPVARQTENMPGIVDLPSLARQTEKMSGSVDLPSLAKQTENMTGSVDFSLAVKQQEGLVKSDDLSEFDEKQVIVQESTDCSEHQHSQSKFSTKSLITASSALAVIIAGLCFLHRYFHK